MYKITADGGLLKTQPHQISIPESIDNRDYRDYLAWVAEGNVAEVLQKPLSERKAERRSTLERRMWRRFARQRLESVDAALSAATTPEEVEAVDLEPV